MTSSRTARRLRWSVPAVVAAGVALAAVLPNVASGSSPDLPPRTAAQLLVAVQRAAVPGLSGTVVETSRLGLPALPAAASDPTSLSWQSLVTGSHTARVWYAGPDRQRIALLDNLAETDVVRNGRDAWTYSSATRTATHLRLPAGHDAARTRPEPLPTPQQAADRALRAISPTTTVSVDRSARVAGRPAYQLVLAPKDARSLISRVALALDSATSVPLRVQVFAVGHGKPAFETAFTDVSFRVPPAAVFRFRPPAGAKVTQRSLPAPTRSPRAPANPGATVLGSGWTAVLRLPAGSVPEGNPETASLLRRLSTPVSGGRLVRTALASMLLTDDGRVYAGAVTPRALRQVAAADSR